MNKRLNSFTLSELLVGLVLTAVVISMTILTLMVVKKEIYAIKSNIELNNEIKVLEQALWVDFSRGNLFYNLEKKELYIASPLDTVTYYFNESYILRNLDTLNVSIKSLKLFLDTEENVLFPDAIHLLFDGSFTGRELFVYKNKDASFYMNTYGI